MYSHIKISKEAFSNLDGQEDVPIFMGSDRENSVGRAKIVVFEEVVKAYITLEGDTGSISSDIVRLCSEDPQESHPL